MDNPQQNSVKLNMNVKIVINMDDLQNKQRHQIPTIGKLRKLSESDIKRICSYTTIAENGCWIWNGTVQDNKKGHQHGYISVNRCYVQVHRIMYHNFIEDVPVYHKNGLVVLHKCTHEQNGRCINPWHLKLGSLKENTQDALKAGTLHIMGSNEENPMSKLPNKVIQEIRSLKGKGFTQREIAVKYNINQSQISRYWSNKTRNIQ